MPRDIDIRAITEYIAQGFLQPPGEMARGNVAHPVIGVILADRNPLVGSDMGDSARPVIEQALTSLGVEMRYRLAREVAADHGRLREGGDESVGQAGGLALVGEDACIHLEDGFHASIELLDT